MNKKAFEMTISTVVLMVLAVVLLIGLVLFLTNGFNIFRSSTDPFLDTTQSSSVKQACLLACHSEDKLTYCCKEYDIDEQEISCDDERLELDCSLDCAGFECQNSKISDEEKCEQKIKCEAIRGAYFNGSECKFSAGIATVICNEGEDGPAPFQTIDECEKTCE